MEKRPLNTPERIHAELLFRAWQERAAARIGRTNKQRTAKAEHAAQALERLARHIDIDQMTRYLANGDPQHDENGAVVVDTVTCGSCGRTWNDALVTAYTPAPAARCPFEAWHDTMSI